MEGRNDWPPVVIEKNQINSTWLAIVIAQDTNKQQMHYPKYEIKPNKSSDTTNPRKYVSSISISDSSLESSNRATYDYGQWQQIPDRYRPMEKVFWSLLSLTKRDNERRGRHDSRLSLSE